MLVVFLVSSSFNRICMRRCHELLRLLLELLALSRRVQPVRVQLYAALLQYLQFCR